MSQIFLQEFHSSTLGRLVSYAIPPKHQPFKSIFWAEANRARLCCSLLDVFFGLLLSPIVNARYSLCICQPQKTQFSTNGAHCSKFIAICEYLKMDWIYLFCLVYLWRNDFEIQYLFEKSPLFYKGLDNIKISSQIYVAFCIWIQSACILICSMSYIILVWIGIEPEGELHSS